MAKALMREMSIVGFSQAVFDSHKVDPQLHSCVMSVLAVAENRQTSCAQSYNLFGFALNHP